MFLQRKPYEVHTLNEDIFLLYFSVSEALKRCTSGSEFNVTLSMPVNFVIQLPSFNFNKTFFALISLCKKFLRCIYFTPVAK